MLLRLCCTVPFLRRVRQPVDIGCTTSPILPQIIYGACGVIGDVVQPSRGDHGWCATRVRNQFSDGLQVRSIGQLLPLVPLANSGMSACCVGAGTFDQVGIIGVGGLPGIFGIRSGLQGILCAIRHDDLVRLIELQLVHRNGDQLAADAEEPADLNDRHGDLVLLAQVEV